MNRDRAITLIIVLNFMIVLLLGVNYNVTNPTKINKIIASTYKTPANKAFTDQNFYNCVIDEYNYENFTKLPYTTSLTNEQLKTIETLHCSDIESVEGISFITGLTDLIIGGEKIANIDVSKNINLIRLDVNNNQLTELDLSKNTNLVQLFVSNNQLTTLDVTNNVNLKELWVDGNKLTNLDVSKNTNLEKLYADRNSLVNINLEKNVNLIELWINYNKLINLDAANNINLVSLYVEGNQLKNLKIGNNNKLTKLSASYNELNSLDVSGIINLTNLNLSANNLVSLDVSKNINLKELDVSTTRSIFPTNTNRLTELDVSHNIKLEKLIAYNSNLNTLNLNGAINLTELNVSGNQLMNLDVSKNTNLTKLDVSGNQLTNLDTSNNVNLTKLHVYYNQLTNLDISYNTKINDLYTFDNMFKLGDEIIYKNNKVDLSNKINTENYKLNNNFTKEYKYGVINNTKLDNSVINNENIGRYDYKIYFKGDSSSSNIQGIYTVYVTDLKSNKYKINEEKGYIYTGTDTNKDMILKNLSTEYGTLEINDNKLQVKDGGKVLKEFDILSLSSDKYMIGDRYVYIGSEMFDKTKINTNATLVEKDNVIEISYGNELLDTYKLIKVTSDKYIITSNFIFVVNESNNNILNNINVINGALNISNNRLQIKYENILVKELIITPLLNSKYIIKNNYIYTGTDTNKETILSNLSTEYGTLEINDNKLQVKDGNNIIKEFKILNLTSKKYKLNNDNIYTNVNEFNKDDINTECALSLKDNLLEVSYDNEVLGTFKLIRITSSKYKITDKYIYTVGNIDLNNINITNGNIKINNNKLEILYNDIVIDSLDILSVDFRTLKVSNNVVVIIKEIPYKEFTDEIKVSNVSYKIYKEAKEVTSGNIEKGMILKVISETYGIIEEYKITNEYIDVSKLNIDENNFINDFEVGDTYKKILDKIDTSGEIKIIDNAGKELTSNDNVRTGSKIRIELTTETKEYTVVVLGDVTGTGKITMADVMKTANYLLDNSVIKEECYKKAADVTKDGNIKISDVMKLANYVLNGKF